MLKICVIGDAMLDIYVNGTVQRISPEAPVPLLSVQRENVKAGGAANVAMAMVELGHDVTFVTRIGNDRSGNKLIKILEVEGVIVESLDPKYPTITKTRYMASKSQILRVDREDCSEFSGEITKSFSDFDAIMVSDYGKGMITKNIFAKLRAEYLGEIFVDPKASDASVYYGANYIFPNIKELLAWFPENTQLNDAEIFRLKEEMNWRNLINTRSEKGIRAFLKTSIANFESKHEEIIDVTGAGDIVLSVFTHCILSGDNTERALMVANQCAGDACMHVGTWYPKKNQMEKYREI